MFADGGRSSSEFHYLRFLSAALLSRLAPVLDEIRNNVTSRSRSRDACEIMGNARLCASFDRCDTFQKECSVKMDYKQDLLDFAYFCSFAYNPITNAILALWLQKPQSAVRVLGHVTLFE